MGGEVGSALFFQGQTLMHAKPMLLINDHQTQTGKDHIVLKQGMRTNHQLCLSGGDF